MTAETLRRVWGFFDAYREAFEAYDADRIVRLFAYPAHIVSDEAHVAPRALPDEASCRPGVQMVLDLHRKLGVRSGRMLEFALLELSAAIAVVTLRYEFNDGAGAPLYDFQGVYTLTPKDPGWGVAAIAHNQIPRLIARVAEG